MSAQSSPRPLADGAALGRWRQPRMGQTSTRGYADALRPFRQRDSKPHPAVWMGAGSERLIRDVARRDFNLLLGQYASPNDVQHSIDVFRQEVESRGRCGWA